MSANATVVGLYAVLGYDPCDFADLVKEDDTPTEILVELHKVLTLRNPRHSADTTQLNEIGASLVKKVLEKRQIPVPEPLPPLRTGVNCCKKPERKFVRAVIHAEAATVDWACSGCEAKETAKGSLRSGVLNNVNQDQYKSHEECLAHVRDLTFHITFPNAEV